MQVLAVSRYPLLQLPAQVPEVVHPPVAQFGSQTGAGVVVAGAAGRSATSTNRHEVIVSQRFVLITHTVFIACI